MKIRSIDPSNGKLLKEFAAADRSKVNATVMLASEAQKSWASLSFGQKEKILRNVAKVIEKRADEILQLIKLETGKTLVDGEAEVYDVIEAVDYYIQAFKRVKPVDVELSKEAFPGTVATIDYQPYGVIGLIMPWNFPFYVPMMLSIVSLVTGNSVVIKPSEYSTMVANLMVSIFEQAGLPKTLVSVLPGADQTGRYLVESSVDRLFFVGSVEVGKDIIARAGVKPVQVELGGNSAALILDDANVSLAAEGVAWGATYISGQDCVGIKRVFVVESVAKEFMTALKRIIKELRPGIDYGPYISKDAMLEVKRRLDQAIKNGAELHIGGEFLSPDGEQGNWLSPSVLTYDDTSLELVSKETFGNVVPVMVVRDVDQAIELANDTNYGLSNVIFSNNLDQARDLASRLESGMVFINDAMIALPGWDRWTGWKESGIGSGESRIMQCLKQKIVSINRSNHKRGFWYPYDK